MSFTLNKNGEKRKRKDYTGQRFWMLTVIKPGYTTKGKVGWLCRCDCGGEKVIQTTNFVNGYTKSCGCLSRDSSRRIGELTRKNYVEYTLGDLLVVSFSYTKNAITYWNAVCVCGSTLQLSRTVIDKGYTKSCGCKLPSDPYERYIRTKYGLTMHDYNYMMANQNGRCKICREKPDKLVVDHDHGTGKVRGLLCNSCNTGLGLLQDAPAVLQSALMYISV